MVSTLQSALVFTCRYSMLPASEINFGAMIVNSRKSRSFTLDNKGDKFEFKFTVTRPVKADGRG